MVVLFYAVTQSGLMAPLVGQSTKNTNWCKATSGGGGALLIWVGVL